MKILTASDIHGSSHFCEKLLKAYKSEKADRLLLLGDILYHGPRNDIPFGYDPKRVITLLNEMKNEIFAVRGNCDTEVDQMVLDFPIMADYAVISLGCRLVFATHGHKFNLKSLPPIKKNDILLHGHTHVPAWESFGNGNLYLNPGSVTLPKENSKRGYIILDEEKAVFKDLDGEIYYTELI